MFLFVLSRCFVRSESVFCSFRFCFSLVLAAFLLVPPLFLWLDSSFFLILFGGFDFVRTFAARNSVWSSAPGCIPGSVAPFAISFLRVS